MSIRRVWAGLLLVSGIAIGGCAATPGGPSFDETRAAAERGDAAAQFRLGVAYDLGQGVARSPEEASAWYRKAADQGEAAAQNSLGSMYQHGHGVSRDFEESMSWYQKAANQGYAEAYSNIGALYDFGLGVTQDKKKAVEYYRTAADKGSVTAMLNLGVSYWRGEGVQKDLVQAYKWLDLGRFYTQRSPNMQLKWRTRGALDEVTKEMTSSQIAEARQLAREWDARNRPR